MCTVVQRLAFVALILMVMVAVSDCGKKQANPQAAAPTPEDAALTVARCLASGDSTTAAAYWAYDLEAREKYTNWDSLPPSEQARVVERLRVLRGRQLHKLVPVFGSAKGEIKCDATGGSTIRVFDDASTLAEITVVKEDTGYRVSNVNPHAAT